MNLPLKNAESAAVTHAEELTLIFNALSALRRGDASARLPYQGSPGFGRVAEVFNDLVEQNATHGGRAGAALPGRRQAGQAAQARLAGERPRLLGGGGGEHQLPDRRPRAPDHRGRARDRRGGAGRSLQDDGARRRRPSPRRGVPAHRQDHQQDGGAARQLLGRSDAGGARGGHRREARRPGEGEGRRRHLEGPDRLRELDGRQPDLPGAQHRGSDDRGGEGRPLEEDQGGREGRVPDAEEHDQHDGGPAPVVRLGSDAGGARGGHGRDIWAARRAWRASPAPGRT